MNIKDTITSDEISAKIKAIETEQDIALDDRQRLAAPCTVCIHQRILCPFDSGFDAAGLGH